MTDLIARRSFLVALAGAFAVPAALLEAPARAAPIHVSLFSSDPFVASHLSGYARVAVTSTLSPWPGSIGPVERARADRKYFARVRYWRRYHRQRLGDGWERIMAERFD